jgi:hypothetical protein
MTAGQVGLIDVAALRQTEAVDMARVAWLIDTIRRDGVWRVPICVERRHHLVMDGHHRTEAARRMGLHQVPCLRFDYEQVRVFSRRPGLRVSPEEVIARGLSGRIYPVKSTRHEFPFALPDCAYPIDALKREVQAVRHGPTTG